MCELPSAEEIECNEKFGYWETWFEEDHVGSGRWRSINRQNGTCIEISVDDDKYTCLSEGGYWLDSYWIGCEGCEIEPELIEGKCELQI